MAAGVEDSDRERRFDEYVGVPGDALNHADRQQPFRNQVTGLPLPGDRKSVEPPAARVAPSRASAERRSLSTFVGESPRDDVAFPDVVAGQVLPALTAGGGVTAWIVDDTGFPKKGKHSVGVARQYRGELGKNENRRVAASPSVATEHAGLPVAYRLYLPEEREGDEEKRKKTGIPADVYFRTEPEIALEQVWDAAARGLAPGVVPADPAYGNDTPFRDGATAPGLAYSTGIRFAAAVRPPPSGRREPDRRRRRPGAAGAGRPGTCAATTNAGRCRSRIRRSVLGRKPGGRCLGAREPTRISRDASPGYGFGRRTGTRSVRNRGRKNGCRSNGPTEKRRRQSIGYRHCLKISRRWNRFVRRRCVGASNVTVGN